MIEYLQSRRFRDEISKQLQVRVCDTQIKYVRRDFEQFVFIIVLVYLQSYFNIRNSK